MKLIEKGYIRRELECFKSSEMSDKLRWDDVPLYQVTRPILLAIVSFLY